MAKMIQVPYDYSINVPVETAQAVQANRENPISLEALGLLVNLSSYPSTWELHKTELYKRFANNKETSVRSAWNELMTANYIIEFKYRVGKKWEYVYYFRKFPFTKEEKAKILDEATKEYGGIWRLDFQDLKMKTSKSRGNKKNILNKNILLNKEEEEEEKTSTSQSELISFLLSKDITLENALIFEKALLQTTITGYTYDDVLKAIEFSLKDFVNGECNEPYKWAVGKLERMLDGKIKDIEKKIDSRTRKGKAKPIRTEKLPEWFDEDEKVDMSKQAPSKDYEEKLKELQQRLEKYKQISS